MKSTKHKEAYLAYKMGESWASQLIAIFVGILLTSFLVWATMPTEQERLINKNCYKLCKQRVEEDGLRLNLLQAPPYLRAIEKCHNECSSVIR